MKLYQISINNLRRRKSKFLFMLLGLVIGTATVVAVHSMAGAMRAEMERRLAGAGANIVIAADTGELGFSYGGISVPELIVDAVKLTEADLAIINGLPARPMMLAVAPKIVGMARAGENNVIVAGSDLAAEFTAKPWLRVKGAGAGEAGTGQEAGAGEDSGKKMSFEKLNLTRSGAPELADDQVLLGAAVAAALALQPGDTLTINGSDFLIAALLEEGGSAEDGQVLMNLKIAQELLQRPGEITVIEIASDLRGAPEEPLLAQLREALPHARVTSVRQAVMGRQELLAGLTRFGNSVSVLLLFTGMLVVTLTMSAAVRERTREIGILRAIGYRGVHVFRIILTEGLLVSLAGGAAGYLLGVLLARFSGPLLSGMAFTVPWRADLLFLALGGTTLIGTLAGIYPAASAAKLDPAEALRFI